VFPEIENGTKKPGRDVTYFTGWIDSAGDLAGTTYAELTAPETSGGLALRQFDVKNQKGSTASTVTLTDYSTDPDPRVWGNAILIGASLDNGGKGKSPKDTIVLNGMTTVVPVPAAVWLFVSALCTLLARRKIAAK
jgi:hypothetical protein